MRRGTGQTGRSGAKLAALWRGRCASDAAFFAASPFPWPQVRPSLRALLPGIARLPEQPGNGRRLALVLAGNTPLVGWPAILAALSGGWRVDVKVSRHDPLWTRLLAETLDDAAPDWAARLALHHTDHAGARSLVAGADAAIVYGSDTAIAALRAAAGHRPFLGFGHALSVAVAPAGAPLAGLARDVLVFDQAGCLSPQALFTEASPHGLPDALRRAVRVLEVPPRTDPGHCRAVREARDLAWMDGCMVDGDPHLRWSVIVHPEPRPLPPPTGLGVLHVLPVESVAAFPEYLGVAAGRLSSVGVAGDPSPSIRDAARLAGASRVCRLGRMQTPPLSWPNGGVDLPRWLETAEGG